MQYDIAAACRRRRRSRPAPADDPSPATTLEVGDPRRRCRSCRGCPRRSRRRRPRARRRSRCSASATRSSRRSSWRFSRQLSSFLEAGIPVLEALEIVGQQTSSKLMRTVIADIGSSIHRGTSFVEAVDAHPDGLPRLLPSDAGRGRVHRRPRRGARPAVGVPRAGHRVPATGEERADISDHRVRRRRPGDVRDVDLRAPEVHRLCTRASAPTFRCRRAC